MKLSDMQSMKIKYSPRARGLYPSIHWQNLHSSIKNQAVDASNRKGRGI